MELSGFNCMYDILDGIVYEEWTVRRLSKGYKATLNKIIFKEDCECEDTPCEHTTETLPLIVGGYVHCPVDGHPYKNNRPFVGYNACKAVKKPNLIEPFGNFEIFEIFWGPHSIGVIIRLVPV
jgi:hypothetical protein